MAKTYAFENGVGNEDYAALQEEEHALWNGGDEFSDGSAVEDPELEAIKVNYEIRRTMLKISITN
jgi:hypothetical protein